MMPRLLDFQLNQRTGGDAGAYIRQSEVIFHE